MLIWSLIMPLSADEKLIGTWPEQDRVGAFRIRFELPGIRDTFDLASRGKGKISQTILAETPRFQINLNVERNLLNLHLFFRAEEAENGSWVLSGVDKLMGWPRETPLDQLKIGVLNLSSLRGDTPYELVLRWDLDEKRIDAWLNGERQGDLFPASKGGWTPARLVGDQWTAGGTLTGPGVDLPLKPHAAEVVKGRVEDGRIAKWSEGLPLLVNEGLRVVEEPLDLDGLEFRTVFAPDPEGIHVVEESELFNEEKTERTGQPGPGDWVLEGAGRVETAEGILRVINGREERGLSATDTKGHVVLWLPVELPQRFLFEYDFQPAHPSRGLHILFWNARGPGGESIFADGLPYRDANFSEYTWRKVDSYHASVFATDDDTPRRVANLRKNSGFVLVACGEDAVAGKGPGPFRIRLLKDGARMAIEVDGRKVLEYDDDGRANGPPLHGGRLGFRLMAHTGSAEFSNMVLKETVSPKEEAE